MANNTRNGTDPAGKKNTCNDEPNPGAENLELSNAVRDFLVNCKSGKFDPSTHVLDVRKEVKQVCKEMCLEEKIEECSASLSDLRKAMSKAVNEIVSTKKETEMLLYKFGKSANALNADLARKWREEKSAKSTINWGSSTFAGRMSTYQSTWNKEERKMKSRQNQDNNNDSCSGYRVFILATFVREWDNNVEKYFKDGNVTKDLFIAAPTVFQRATETGQQVALLVEASLEENYSNADDNVVAFPNQTPGGGGKMADSGSWDCGVLYLAVRYDQASVLAPIVKLIQIVSLSVELCKDDGEVGYWTQKVNEVIKGSGKFTISGWISKLQTMANGLSNKSVELHTLIKDCFKSIQRKEENTIMTGFEREVDQLQPPKGILDCLASIDKSADNERKNNSSDVRKKVSDLILANKNWPTALNSFASKKNLSDVVDLVVEWSNISPDDPLLSKEIKKIRAERKSAESLGPCCIKPAAPEA